MAALINSDIFVDALRGSENAKDVLKNLSEQEHIFYSLVSVAEILSNKGCDDPKIREATMKIFSIFEPVALDDILVQKAAYFRRRYSLLLPDAIIAATAAQLKAELITGNTKDFSVVKEIKVKSPY